MIVVHIQSGLETRSGMFAVRIVQGRAQVGELLKRTARSRGRRVRRDDVCGDDAEAVT